MTPSILYIAREPLIAGREDDYRRIEEETARLSAELGCPHPYLAMEALTGPKEIWWFNGFDSDDDLKRVGDAYAQNERLSAALKKNQQRKAPFTGPIVELAVHHRPDLSRGDPWIPGHVPYAVIAVAQRHPLGAATVFEAADGRFFSFCFARTRQEADRLAGALEDSIVAVVRPSLSFSAGE